MSVYVHESMTVHVRACMSVHVHERMPVHVRACMSVHVHERMSVHVHEIMSVHVRACMSVHVRACMMSTYHRHRDRRLASDIARALPRYLAPIRLRNLKRKINGQVKDTDAFS